MTANEMSLQVKIQYEKLNSGGGPGIQDSVMSRVLSNAQLYYALTRINNKTNRLGEGIEQTELRGEGLSMLLSTEIVLPLAPTTDNVPNGTFFPLPKDYWFNIVEYATIDKISCVTKQPIQAFVRAIRHDELIKMVSNSYKQPYYDNQNSSVLRLFYSRDQSGYNSSFVNFLNPTTNPTYNPTIDDGYNYLTTQTAKRHELVTDGTFNITSYYVRYYRMPRQIVVDSTVPQNQRHCELDNFTHQDIIDIAVDMLKQSLQQPNTKTISQPSIS